MQYSVTVRDNQLNQIELSIGPNPVLRMYTGTKPINCAAPVVDILILETILPSDWLSTATNGNVTKVGLWQAAATGTGIIGYFRIYDSTGLVCHMQGTITLLGEGGDMIVDNTSVRAGQIISVNSFSINAGNA